MEVERRFLLELRLSYFVYLNYNGCTSHSLSCVQQMKESHV